MIKNRIKERMTVLNLRAVDLMNATGASKSSVSKWVNGARDPSAKYLVKLAETLKCKVDWLVFGDGLPKKSCGILDECLKNFDYLTTAQQQSICTQVEEMAQGNRRSFEELKKIIPE